MPYFFQTTPGVLILLVRHGSTALNEPTVKLIRGWVDEPLDAKGQLDIIATAEKLRPYNPQYIFSSDFMRDTQTAQILASRLGVAGVESDFDIRTWDVGLFSGTPESDNNGAIQELYRRSWEVPPGSSESFDDFARRWLGILDCKMNFATIEGFRPTIIVTHGRNIALTDSHFNQKLAWDGTMPLAGGFAVIAVNPDRSVSCEIQGESECVCEDV